MAKRKRYLPSYKRSPDVPAMRLTRRDIDVVLAVYKYRFLNAHQIEALFFPSHPDRQRSRKQACQRRLQLLYHHGYLSRLPMPVILGKGRSPYTYALDEAGANLVATELGIDRPMVYWKPADNRVKPLFLDHTIAINSVLCVVTTLADQKLFSVARWLDEATLKSSALQEGMPYSVRGARPTRIYPDGYFALQLPDREQPAHFFLELDQGTMTNSRWQGKIHAYMHFRRSGLSQKSFNTRNFRMLTVTSSQRRLANLKRATEEVGGDRHFWFTVQEHIDFWQPDHFLDPIWQIAGDSARYSIFGHH